MNEYCVDIAVYIKARNRDEAQEAVSAILERGAYEIQIFPEDTEVLHVMEVHYE